MNADSGERERSSERSDVGRSVSSHRIRNGCTSPTRDVVLWERVAPSTCPTTASPSRLPFAQYTAQDMQNLRTSESRTFTMSVRIPNPEAVAASSLKAAYLAVFSLLGPMEGYDYVRGKALRAIRQRILAPLNHGAVRKFVIDARGNSPDKDIILVRQPVPCWLIRIQNRFVVLPCSGGNSTSEPLKVLSRHAGNGTVRVSGGASWMFQTFGAIRSTRVHLRGADRFDSLVGLTIGGTLPNGRPEEGTCIRHVGEHATLLCADRET